MSIRFAPSGILSVDPPRAGGTVAADQAAAVTGPEALEPSVETGGCSDSSDSNVRVNQDCTNQSAPALLGRGQSQNETAVAVDPTDPNNVIVGQNDYRRGDGTCGVDFSLNRGKRWGRGLIPITPAGFSQFFLNVYDGVGELRLLELGPSIPSAWGADCGRISMGSRPLAEDRIGWSTRSTNTPGRSGC